MLPTDERAKLTLNDWWLVAVMVLAIVAVYQGVAGCGFINLDDPNHVYLNPVVTGGLNWDGIITAFSKPHASLWVPLTTISFMADVSLFGLSARAMHLENLAWHVGATVLLFFSMRALTGSQWRSALVAMLFGLHPINVESVAWIAERKNVLCAFFSFAMLRCWASYVKKPGALSWIGALLLFAAALMAKPMAVTLPFALLLLDWWPLQRWGRVPWWSLIMEKAPLFALSFLASRFALWAADSRETVPTLADLSLEARLSNAVTSIGEYVGDLVWPSALAILYPHPVEVRWLPAVAIGIALLAATGLAWALRRSHPWLIVGWLMFGGMLVPSLGLVQAGAQARADRFTYLAQIGFWFALVWTVARWWPKFLDRARFPLAAAMLAVLGVITARQVSVWQNGSTVFAHSLRITGPNAQILDFLAASYARYDDRKAIGYWLKSLLLIPASTENWVNVAAAAERLGDLPRAREAYRQALLIDPGNQEFTASYERLNALLETPKP